jgi:hypothetical protein
VRALLPNVDEHRPVHNLDSLEALGRALSQSLSSPGPAVRTARAGEPGARSG